MNKDDDDDDDDILVKSGTRRSRSVPPFRSENYTNPVTAAADDVV